MNPLARKAFNELNKNLYNVVNIHKTREPFKTLAAYTAYSYHLARIYAPRIAHFDTYADAYTPKRTKYNAYIVFGLIGAFTLYESSRIANAKKQAQTARLEAKA